MQALDRCINGCDAPPRAPSKVLCETCLRELGQRMEKLFEERQREGE